VGAQHLAVVRVEDDRGLIQAPALVCGFQHLADAVVHKRHAAVVCRPGLAPVIRGLARSYLTRQMFQVHARLALLGARYVGRKLDVRGVVHAEVGLRDHKGRVRHPQETHEKRWLVFGRFADELGGPVGEVHVLEVLQLEGVPARFRRGEPVGYDAVADPGGTGVLVRAHVGELQAALTDMPEPVCLCDETAEGRVLAERRHSPHVINPDMAHPVPRLGHEFADGALSGVELGCLTVAGGSEAVDNRPA